MQNWVSVLDKFLNLSAVRCCVTFLVCWHRPEYLICCEQRSPGPAATSSDEISFFTEVSPGVCEAFWESSKWFSSSSINQVFVSCLLFLDCRQLSSYRFLASSQNGACFSIFREIFFKDPDNVLAVNTIQWHKEVRCNDVESGKTIWFFNVSSLYQVARQPFFLDFCLCMQHFAKQNSLIRLFQNILWFICYQNTHSCVGQLVVKIWGNKIHNHLFQRQTLPWRSLGSSAAAENFLIWRNFFLGRTAMFDQISWKEMHELETTKVARPATLGE